MKAPFGPTPVREMRTTFKDVFFSNASATATQPGSPRRLHERSHSINVLLYFKDLPSATADAPRIAFHEQSRNSSVPAWEAPISLGRTF